MTNVLYIQNKNNKRFTCNFFLNLAAGFEMSSYLKNALDNFKNVMGIVEPLEREGIKIVI